MPLAFPEAYEFVESHRDHLGVSDADAYVARLRVFMDQQPGDGGAAATVAVGSAKNLINIAVAFFAALGAFALAYLSTHATFNVSIPVVLLAASALLTIASMIAGFVAIGGTYRSQRAAETEGVPWTPRRLSRWFGAQPLLGLGALVMFAIGLFFWDAGPGPAADPRMDQLQGRVEALQARLDQQAADLAAAIQASNANHAASAAPPLNFVGLTQVPPKLDAIVNALRELKAAIPPPPPPPQPVVEPQPPAMTAPPAPVATTSEPARQEADLSHADWVKIQEALSAQGFAPGKADGFPRRKTREAIRAYQAKHHAPEDGRLTPQQIDALLGAH